jgi:hypothetical protein
MTNIQGNIWNAKIPAFPYGTSVTYIIVAEDNFSNVISSQEMGFEYRYNVIPEFSSFLILPICIAATLLVNIVHRRKNLKSIQS